MTTIHRALGHLEAAAAQLAADHLSEPGSKYFVLSAQAVQNAIIWLKRHDEAPAIDVTAEPDKEPAA